MAQRSGEIVLEQSESGELIHIAVTQEERKNMIGVDFPESYPFPVGFGHYNVSCGQPEEIPYKRIHVNEFGISYYLPGVNPGTHSGCILELTLTPIHGGVSSVNRFATGVVRDGYVAFPLMDEIVGTGKYSVDIQRIVVTPVGNNDTVTIENCSLGIYDFTV